MGCGACCPPILLPLPNPNPFLPPCGSALWKDSLMSCRTGPTSGAAGLALEGDMLMLLSVYSSNLCGLKMYDLVI